MVDKMKKRNFAWLKVLIVIAVTLLGVSLIGYRNDSQRPIGIYMDTLNENGAGVTRLHLESVFPMKEVIITSRNSNDATPNTITLQGDLGTSIVQKMDSQYRAGRSITELTVTVYTNNGSQYVIPWTNPPAP